MANLRVAIACAPARARATSITATFVSILLAGCPPPQMPKGPPPEYEEPPPPSWLDAGAEAAPPPGPAGAPADAGTTSIEPSPSGDAGP